MNWRLFCYVLAKVAYQCGGYSNGRELVRVCKPVALPVSEVRS